MIIVKQQKYTEIRVYSVDVSFSGINLCIKFYYLYFAD